MNKLVITTLILLVCGCISQEQNYGYEKDVHSISKLKINNSSKENVIALLGSPSTISSLDENIWYYINVKTIKKSILKPKVVAQDVLKLTFKNNILKKIEEHSNKTKKYIKFNESKTKVEGNETNLIKDTLYNMGRFNKDRKK